jgi:septal ring-binding cell division protein DamX
MKVNLKLELDKRQKIILVLILLSLGILIWQIHGFFSDKQTVELNKNVSYPVKSKSISPPLPSQVNPVQPVLNTSETDAVQQKYLSLVNEYQLVEIEKMIAQDEASIAAARAQSAESMAKIAQISGETPNYKGGNGNAAVSNSGEYELIYTGEDNHQWTATLRKQGQFNDVTAGSVLPDGSKVVSVDDNGVTLMQGEVRKLVTFNGVTPLPHQNVTPQEEVRPKPTQVKLVEKPTAPMVSKAVLLPPLPVPQNLVNSSHSLDITKMDKKAYTIQMILGDNLSQIRSLINQYKLENQTQVIKVMRSGQTVYIAIYGNYPDIDTALDAMDELPAQIQKLKPFVKTAGDLQLEMEKKS